MKEYLLNVESDMENERIDRYVTYALADFSRSYIQRLTEAGDLTVNGKSVRPSYRVKADDNILVRTDSVIPEIVPERIKLDILYEDEDLLVVNKPKGMVVHPAPGHYEHTLVNAVMYHCRENLSGINGVMRPGIVHRIDKDTTGSLVICKNNRAHECIAAQLEEHSIRREYIAMVTGVIDTSGTVNAPIARSRSDRKKMCITPDGKRAVTNYEVLKNFDRFTLVKCRLETGRTHQIRVHMASINHPVAGDTVYGNGMKTPVETNGQALHAYLLGFIHPSTGEYMEFTAPFPEYLDRFITCCEKV